MFFFFFEYDNFFISDINFDFFNYAGIHRPVILYTLPRWEVKVKVKVMS